jgi:hypothetical protein
MDWTKVKWEPLEDKQVSNLRIRGLHADIAVLKGKEGIGVDPGRAFGVAVVDPAGSIDVVWSQMIQEEQGLRWRYGIKAIDIIQNLLRDAKGDSRGFPAVVEGAAYHSEFGQVGLAEVRFGFAYGLHEAGYDVCITPPARIRAVVMGKFEHKEYGGMYGYWPKMDHNAADAVGVALFAAGWKGETK